MIPQESDDERFVTLKVAAYELGLPYWKLLRAVKAGTIPTYRILNSRRLVRVPELSLTAPVKGVPYDARKCRYSVSSTRFSSVEIW